MKEEKNAKPFFVRSKRDEKSWSVPLLLLLYVLCGVSSYLSVSWCESRGWCSCFLEMKRSFEYGCLSDGDRLNEERDGMKEEQKVVRHKNKIC